MSDHTEKDNQFGKIISKLVNIIVFLIIVIAVLLIALINNPGPAVFQPEREPAVPDEYGNFTEAAKLSAREKKRDTTEDWQAPVAELMEKGPQRDLILYGKDLIVHTSTYFGANGKIYASTNGMNCQNCHLEAGTKPFGNNYSAVASTYPKYRARSGSVEDIYKRVNDCFERSLNGKALDTSSKEMHAIVAYIHWLGKDVPKGKKSKGSGLKDLAFLGRAASVASGKSIYIQKCQSCHQANGEGILTGDKTAYTYPPLWGKHSYNDGAGLYRLSNFAKFIKYNMPQGATYTSPQLSDEEAWDLAAFVNSQERPHGLTSHDWPRISEKPVDYPFGPYIDGFHETQHKLGPFQPILAKLGSRQQAKK